jgi:hypothetical protein
MRLKISFTSAAAPVVTTELKSDETAPPERHATCLLPSRLMAQQKQQRGA